MGETFRALLSRHAIVEIIILFRGGLLSQSQALRPLKSLSLVFAESLSGRVIVKTARVPGRPSTASVYLKLLYIYSQTHFPRKNDF